MPLFRKLLLLLTLVSLGGCVPPLASALPIRTETEARAPVTILISIDGFRPDYLERGITPNLNALAAGGVKARMRPSFPTKTFPNHYTIVTGLRPDVHGIVENNMEDPRRPGVRFTLGSAQAQDPFWWDEAEPIWVTAEKAGIRTGTMFWPGSEAPIRGVRPTAWLRYDSAISATQRVEYLVDWLRRPSERRPRFLTLYFEAVDDAGHYHGLHTPEMRQALIQVDEHVGTLVRELQALGQPANLVVVSDHGMIATSPERVIRVDRLIDPAAINVVTDGPFLAFEPRPGREAEAAKLIGRHPHMECWRKEKLPARFEFGRHPRVTSLFCLAESGWLIIAKEPTVTLSGATHGYDNGDPGMDALFIAQGPAFAKGTSLPMFENVHVYPLLARLVGVAPQPNQGRIKAFEAALAR